MKNARHCRKTDESSACNISVPLYTFKNICKSDDHGYVLGIIMNKLDIK